MKNVGGWLPAIRARPRSEAPSSADGEAVPETPSRRRRVYRVGAGVGGVALLGATGWLVFSNLSAPPATIMTVPVPSVATVDTAQPGLTPPADPSSPERSLNEVAATEARPNAGIVVPSVSAAAFAGIAEPEAADALPQAPDPALVEPRPEGPLPRIGPDGRKAWQVYGRPFDARDDRPRIAVIVSGLGLSPVSTEAAVRLLPATVTLAFDGYARDLEYWVPKARQAGHEVLLTVPMESADFPFMDAGPQALNSSLRPSDNVRRLEGFLVRATGYVGVLTHMASKFNTAGDKLRPMLQALNGRGLMFVDGTGTDDNLAPQIAAELDLPRAYRDLVLDDDPAPQAIGDQLSRAEAIARERAVAVVVARPYPSTLRVLSQWLDTIESKSLALVPVTATASRQFLP